MGPNPSLVRCARSHPLPQVRQLEQENERLVEAERQTAAELAQRLAEIASVGQVAHQHRVDRELLHVSRYLLFRHRTTGSLQNYFSGAAVVPLKGRGPVCTNTLPHAGLCAQVALQRLQA